VFLAFALYKLECARPPTRLLPFQVSQAQLDAAAAAADEDEEKPAAAGGQQQQQQLAPGRIVTPAQHKALRRKAEVEAVLGQLQAAVAPLERCYKQAAEAAAAAAAAGGEEGPYAGMATGAWWALQAAVVLRSVAASYVQGVLANVPGAPAYPQLQACLEAAEAGRMALLQRHLYQSLAGGSPAQLLARPLQQQEAVASLLLMADWASLNVMHPLLRAEDILPLVADTYATLGGQPMISGEFQGREEVAPFDKKLGLKAGGRPTDAARVTLGRVAGQEVEVARCGATLLAVAQPGGWACGACGQQYLHPPCRQLDGSACPPYCLYCGVRLAAGGRGPAQLAVPAAVVPPPALDPQEVS
jgi:hypothetical protein